MNDPLFRLILDRLAELGQVAMSSHCELEKWHEPKLGDMQRTQLGLQLKGALEEQVRWLRALEEDLDKEKT